MRKGILEELKKSSISVTEIANQSWCEYKVYLSCLEKEKTTKAMEVGEAIHRKLQKEVYKELSVEPVSYPDIFYRNAYENIMTIKSIIDNGKGRELKIEGNADGFTLRGKVDELFSENGETVIVENKTINMEGGARSEASDTMHSVQAMLYRMLFKDIIERRYTFRRYYDSNSIGNMRLSPKFAEGLKEIGIKGELINIGTICSNMFDAFYELPRISDTLVIRYIDRRGGDVVEEIRVKYDEPWLRKKLNYDLMFWNKERDPQPVPREEAWKCKSCYFMKIKRCSFGLGYLGKG